jgi:hypothetical protein
MCDQILSKKYSTQNTDKTIEFNPNSIIIPYKGPTTGLETSLRSSKNQKTKIQGKTSFEVSDEICDRDNFLETKAILSIEKLMTGPYETVGSQIEFKDLYFHFKNLKMYLRVKFYFNPLSICRTEEETASTKGNGALMLLVDEEMGVEFERYFVTNGEKETDVNDLFFDLESFFKNYNSTFGIFFDAIVDKFEFNQEIGHLIRNEFVKILCEHKKEPKSEVVRYQCYQEKISYLKQNNIYSLIKGGSFSKMGIFNPDM